MRVLSTAAIAALDSGRFRVRCLLRADIVGHTFAIWDDLGTLSFEGVDYVGAPGRFTIAQAWSVSDLSARNIDVTLSGLDQVAANLIDGVAWHQRPVTILRAILTEDDPHVIHVMPLFTGFLDQMIRREKVDGTSTLTFRCEASARELSRNGARTRSDADQRYRDPTDGFFKYVASAVVTSIEWGRTNAPPPQKRKKFLGIF